MPLALYVRNIKTFSDNLVISIGKNKEYKREKNLLYKLLSSTFLNELENIIRSIVLIFLKFTLIN